MKFIVGISICITDKITIDAKDKTEARKLARAEYCDTHKINLTGFNDPWIDIDFDDADDIKEVEPCQNECL